MFREESQLAEQEGADLTPRPKDASLNRLATTLANISRIPGDNGSRKGRFPHPFPARMPFEIAETAISNLSKKGDLVLDPMCGGGTTLRAAALQGRNSVGIDMDPLAREIAVAYSGIAPGGRIEELGALILEVALKKLAATSLDQFLTELGEEERQFLEYWFPCANQHQLFCLFEAIVEIVPKQFLSTFITIFSSTIIARSAGASWALDLSRSRPHRSLAKQVRSPFELWQQKVREFGLFAPQEPLVGVSRVVEGDARDVRAVRTGEVDLILTSPPYLDAIDYIRTSKFSLVFMGRHLSDLRDIRGSMVGSTRGIKNIPVAPELERRLLRMKNEKKRSIVRRYLLDMTAALGEAYRVLKPGGIAIYGLGPSIVSRSRYDAGEVFCQLAEAVGFSTASPVRRDLSARGRSLPPPSGKNGSSAIYKRMTCEFYVGISKRYEPGS